METVIDALIRRLQSEGVDASWVKPHQVHLTLAFFKEISEPEISGMVRHLDKLLSGKMFDVRISLDRLGCFPNVSRPNVLWVGVRSETGDLKKLKEIIDGTISSFIRDPVESREFKPHLTLARFKPRHHCFSPHVLTSDISRLVAGEHKIKKLVFFKSELLADGPKYTALHEFFI